MPLHPRARHVGCPRRRHSDAAATVAARAPEAPRPYRIARGIQLEHEDVISTSGRERGAGAVGKHEAHGALEAPRRVGRPQGVHGDGLPRGAASHAPVTRCPCGILCGAWLNSHRENPLR